MSGADLPAWIQAATGLVQVGHIVWTVREQRARQFVKHFQGETRLDDDAIAAAIQEHPALATLAVQGLEAAMRAAAEEKLFVLARVVASAFTGDTARIDEAQVMLRTAAALEPYDMRVLVEIAKPRPDSFPDSPIVGSMPETELARQLPGDQRSLVAPIAASLVREGLIINEGDETIGRVTAWFPSTYGFRFLRFLPERSIHDVSDTTVVGVCLHPHFRLKNLGPGDASVVEVSVTYRDESMIPEPPQLPIELGAGESMDFSADGIHPDWGATIKLCWFDGRGVRHESARNQRQP